MVRDGSVRCATAVKMERPEAEVKRLDQGFNRRPSFWTRWTMRLDFGLYSRDRSRPKGSALGRSGSREVIPFRPPRHGFIRSVHSLPLAPCSRGPRRVTVTGTGNG